MLNRRSRRPCLPDPGLLPIRRTTELSCCCIPCLYNPWSDQPICSGCHRSGWSFRHRRSISWKRCWRRHDRNHHSRKASCSLLQKLLLPLCRSRPRMKELSGLHPDHLFRERLSQSNVCKRKVPV